MQVVEKNPELRLIPDGLDSDYAQLVVISLKIHA